MSCVVASSPLAASALIAPSPFRPPKMPIRSLPRKKTGPSPIQPLPVASKPAAVGVQIHRSSTPSSPVAPSPVHNGVSGPVRVAGGHQRGTAPSPVAVGVGLPTKALPIINKQTGEAIVPVLNGHSHSSAPAVATTSVPQPKPGAPTPPVALSVDAFEVPPVAVDAKKSSSPRDAVSPVEPSSPASEPAIAPLSPKIAPAEGGISEQSLATRIYTTKEMTSLRGTMHACPETLLQLVLSGELFPNCPSRYKAAQAAAAATGSLSDDGACLGRDAFGAASTSLDKAAAIRLRQVKETHQKVMSVLSRVTPEKYEALKRELLDLPLRQTDEKQLKQVVNVFFEKAVQEPLYSELYASLVSHMCSVSEAERQLSREEKDKLFAFRMRRELLNKCQEEFTKPITTSADELESLSEGEVELLHRKYKKRLCGNIKFVCELYARSLVTDRVIDSILITLTSMGSEEDYVAEAIATTLNSAGSAFSQLQPEAFERHMKFCSNLQRNHRSARIRFLMMDLEDSRRRGFEKRKQVMTQEELDRQQFEDQKKFQEDIEKALREQSARTSRRSKPTKQAPPTPTQLPNVSTPTNGDPTGGNRVSSGASVPGSPVTPLRSTKIPRGTRIEHGTVLTTRFETSTPTSMLSPISETATQNVPQFSMYKDPSAAASTNSLSSLGPFTPTGDAKQSLTKEQVEKTSRELMSALAVGDATPEQIVSRIEHDLPERHQRRAVLGGWLRRAVATTKLFTEREQLPALFHAILATASKHDDSVPVLSASDVARAMHEWIINDIDCQQYDNCPRMFFNWASVLEAASKFADSDGSLDLDPATLMQPGTLNLFLQELRAHSESSAFFEQFVREIGTPADAAAENNIMKAVRDLASMLQDVPQHSPIELVDRHLALMQRFRPTAHLMYVEGNNVEEMLQKALLNPKVKDELELLHLKTFLQCPPAAIAEECRAHVANSPRTASLSAVHLLMKTASAALGALLPFHASTIQPEVGRNFFASCAIISPERAAAVTAFMRNAFATACSKMAAEIPQWLGGASGQADAISRRLCGLAVMSEVLHHITFAVSENTNRSVPASPTNPHTPIIPLPRAVSTSSLSTLLHAQLEFEQSFATQLTSRLNEVFVVAEATRIVPQVCRSEITSAVQEASLDFWFVSPPSSFRGNRTALGIILSPPAPEMSREASVDDLATPPRRSGSRECPPGYSLHSRTLASSIAQGFIAVH